jgi:hypothetical protein
VQCANVCRQEVRQRLARTIELAEINPREFHGKLPKVDFVVSAHAPESSIAEGLQCP